MTPTWNASDFDAGSDGGVVHENTPDTQYSDASEIRKGDPTGAPLYSSDLVAWYPLQETSGGTAYDFSGNNNHGTVSGASQGGGANVRGLLSYFFDGSDDYVELPVLNSLFNSGPPYTYTVIIKTTEEDFDYVFGATDDAYTRTGSIVVSQGNLGHYDGGGTYTSSLPVNDGNLHFCAVTDDGTDIRFRVDDQTEVASGESDGWGSTPNAWYIGNRNPSIAKPFGGSIFDVRGYNVALTESEVADIYDVFFNPSTHTSVVKTS